MSKFLISFLGRGRRPQRDTTPPPDQVSRSGYVKSEYRFSKDETYATTLFSWALWRHLSRQKNVPDALLILGTATSSWSMLADIFLDDRDLTDELVQRVSDWQTAVRSKEDDKNEGVGQSDLDKIPPLIAETAGIPRLELCIIPDCTTVDEQQMLVKLFVEKLSQGDEVILDITNGFRHFSIIASYVMMVLQWQRNVTIGGMYNGAAEMIGSRGFAPVIDLQCCADYARAASSLATASTTGDYRALGPLFSEEAAKAASQAAFYEAVYNPDQAATHAAQVGKEISADAVSDPLLREIAGTFKTLLPDPGGASHAKRLLDQADRFLARGQFLPAESLCFEAILLHAQSESKLVPDPKSKNAYTDFNKALRKYLKKQMSKEDFKYFCRITDLRNLLAHGRGSFGRSRSITKKALKNEAALTTRIQEDIAFARRICA